MEMLNSKSDKIKVKGHRGTWYVIITVRKYGNTYYLLESEQYGEDAAHIAIRQDGSLLLDEIYNGITDIHEYLEENPLKAF